MRYDAPAVLSREDRDLHVAGQAPVATVGIAPVLPQGLGPRAISQWLIVQRLSAQEWQLLMNSLPGRVGARARRGGNTRRFIEAVLWVAQTGAYWSDLPREFGSWHGIYVRFIRWAQDGNWGEVITRLDPQDQRSQDLQALVQRYLKRNNTKHLSRVMRGS
ncbi:transposase [Pseudoxanthomonas sp. Root630]|uniref:transposase n=1 Tax=Pseudoxanthomonas sp. Root630 TaxID=1736574 RepID=UPI000ACA11BC|nr:transposase [Pseudoxanthomonas sp. Root630]